MASSTLAHLQRHLLNPSETSFPRLLTDEGLVTWLLNKTWKQKEKLFAIFSILIEP